MNNPQQLPLSQEDDWKKTKIKNPLTTREFAKFKTQTLSYWPTMKYLPKEYESISLFDYSKSYIRTNAAAKQQRINEFAKILKEETEKLLGREMAESVERQIHQNHSISTAQHFSPLSHSKTLNPTLQNALPYFDNNSDACRNVIVLSCSNISFDNSWLPRGLIFHSEMEDKLSLHQLTFFSRKVRPFPVFQHPAYDKAAIEKMKQDIDSLYSQKEINKELRVHLHELIEQVYGAPSILESELFTDQVTKTDYLLWQKIFSHYKGHVPNLLFISQEQIVLRLLKDYILKSENNPVYTMLFGKDSGKLIDKYFNGILGAFEYERNYGTYMFWGRPPGEKYRSQLWRVNGMLTTPDRSHSYALTPNAILEGIEKGELIPSTMLSFVILSCYYGLILTGGLDQPRYLSEMKEAYIKVMTDSGNREAAEEAIPTPTTDITITRPTLAYITDTYGTRIPATGIDMALYSDHNAWPSIVRGAKEASIDNIIDRLLPNIYDEYCPKEAFDDVLANINEEEIEKLTGLDKKIPPLATLR